MTWKDVLIDEREPSRAADWWWAYVTGTDPLRIRRENETVPLGATPSTLVSGLTVGMKVRVVNYLGQATIIGRAGGSAPSHAFPTVAAMDVSGLPDGSLALVTADNGYYVRAANKWQLLWAPSDPGWHKVPINSGGIAGAVYWSVVGPEYMVYLDLTGTFSTGRTSLSGVIPANHAPTLGSAHGVVYFANARHGVAWLSSAGNLGVENTTGSAQTSARGTLVYRVLPIP